MYKVPLECHQNAQFFVFISNSQPSYWGRPQEPPIGRVDHSHTNPTGAASVNFSGFGASPLHTSLEDVAC